VLRGGLHRLCEGRIQDFGMGVQIKRQNFGTPLISLERLKIQTSKFVHGLVVRDTTPKMKKWQEGGVAVVT